MDTSWDISCSFVLLLGPNFKALQIGVRQGVGSVLQRIIVFLAHEEAEGEAANKTRECEDIGFGRLNYQLCAQWMVW